MIDAQSEAPPLQHTKSRYRVRNWGEYEAGLRRRGDVTVWLSDEALEAWQAPPSGRPGGQRRYADIAIEAALTIRMVFHLPLRQTEGFLNSLMQLLDVDLPIPDHTTLSRRLQTLGEIGFQPATKGPLHLLIDSTGLRIHVGHLRKPPRNRALRKLHLAVDAKSGQIVASELTNHRIRDSTPVPALLEQTDHRLASLRADATYDRKSVYEAAQRKGSGQVVRVLIPPTRNARLKSSPSTAMEERNRNVRAVRELGRRKWHKQSGYSQRSMVENTVYRYKTILGRDMRSLCLDGQRVEVQIGCKVLNRIALFAMPDSAKVA
jgi:hypothetical protein